MSDRREHHPAAFQAKRPEARSPGSSGALLLVTSHFHSPLYRKTDIHFIAEAFVRLGWRADIVTVGQSAAKQLLRPATARLVGSVRTAHAAGRSRVGGHVASELVHPFSGASPWLEFATSPLLKVYGRRLDSILKRLAAQADLVLIEGGYPLLYHASLACAAPGACIGCLLNDDLAVVGFRKAIVDRAKELMPSFDFVRVPARGLLKLVPGSAHAVFLPHGVDKAAFDRCSHNPYAPDTRNVVSVGNMLFDEQTATRMAESSPDVRFHIIGAAIHGPVPPNLVLHGELAYEATVPFIKFADAGLAPYRMNAAAGYLAGSSMKLLQYAYCGLPILLPNHLDCSHPNAVRYDPGDPLSVAGAVREAIAQNRTPATASQILDWSDVAERLLQEWARVCNRETAERVSHAQSFT
jgi:2-beta-glucuronyltransferase